MDGGLVQDQLAQALFQGSQGDQAVGERHADVALYGGIRQIPLKAGNGQFHGQEGEYGVCHAQVALGILEIDGVHLVRHGRGTHLVLVDFLAEILHGNIGPDVAAKVNQDGVDAPQAVEQGSQVVVVLDLGGGEGPVQAQRGYESVAESNPVDIRISHLVGVHVARSAAELGGIRQAGKLAKLLFEPHHEDLEFLAHAGRGSRLAVCLGQHRDVLPGFCIGLENVQNFLQHRQIDLFHGFLEHQWLGGVVDVLRGQAEVDELAEPLQAHLLQLLLDEVFHGFYVVVGHLFNVLYPLGLVRGHVPVNGAQVFETGAVEVFQLGQGNAAQGDEVFDFHPHAVADKGKLAEIRSQDLGLGCIAAVDGGDGKKG